jgi:DNA-directed RNA polymerase alpha subunit
MSSALAAAGIDTPERLLFMKDAELKAASGIGKASLAEIAAYRKRYTPE